MEKLIITAALCGSQVTKEQNENLPVTPVEIAEDAYRCYNAGASIVHIHARDPVKEKTDLEVYGECVERIREKCNVIVQVSTGGRDRFGNQRTDEERVNLIDVKPKPDMISVNTGTFLFHAKHRPKGASKGWFLHMNTPALIEKLVIAAREKNIRPEFEVFNLGGIFDLNRLIEKGILDEEEKISLSLIMGVAGTQPCDVKNLVFLVENNNLNCHWTIMAVARAEFPMVTAGIIMGAGGARVGLEDNIYLSKGVKASNAQLVEKIIRIARDVNREISTVEEARQMLKL